MMTMFLFTHLFCTVSADTLVWNKSLVVNTWSELGCEQDQIVVSLSKKVTIKLWAGDEYGWLNQYLYWSIDNDKLLLREDKKKNSALVETWTLKNIEQSTLTIERHNLDGVARETQLQKCL